jgi:hypothetical protein
MVPKLQLQQTGAAVQGMKAPQIRQVPEVINLVIRGRLYPLSLMMTDLSYNKILHY